MDDDGKAVEGSWDYGVNKKSKDEADAKSEDADESKEDSSPKRGRPKKAVAN